ncbi:hypothetical protein [Rivularia sp. UHCC 0363]|uniref:hypothetical protein n=1 Tax=Rivularia sp. UHCC 0363 TaxID=3110244 RepID=UPI002B20A2B6|nr:hypothetical protein [Rivularia sp. UHCC 0363]MEA5598390.1 hypothetical protein [Rivularia sp. UHCC 0363]
MTFSFAFPANAAITCRDYNGHEICVLDIKRSAKRYWNYRTTISIDGKKQPEEIYNCRGEFKIQNNGKIVPFGEDDPGNLVCQFYKK